MIGDVTERSVWVWLIAAQKLINRPGWWKGRFALFQMLAAGGGGGRGWWVSVQRPTPPLVCRQAGGEGIYRVVVGGATCRNNTVISNSYLQIGHQWSDQDHLDSFRYS